MSHNELSFLPEKMKINKLEKLICNLNDEEKYAVHMIILKQPLNYRLKLKNVNSVLELNWKE